jgi:hypothetical protein
MREEHVQREVSVVLVAQRPCLRQWGAFADRNTDGDEIGVLVSRTVFGLMPYPQYSLLFSHEACGFAECRDFGIERVAHGVGRPRPRAFDLYCVKFGEGVLHYRLDPRQLKNTAGGGLVQPGHGRKGFALLAQCLVYLTASVAAFRPLLEFMYLFFQGRSVLEGERSAQSLRLLCEPNGALFKRCQASGDLYESRIFAADRGTSGAGHLPDPL